MLRLPPRILLLLAALALAAFAARGEEIAAANPTPSRDSAVSAGYGLAWNHGIGKAQSERLRLRLVFSEESLRLVPILPAEKKPWEWSETLVRFGSSQATRPAGRAWLAGVEDRAEYLRGSLIERFRNTPQGIEHMLEIPEEPGAEVLYFDFAVSGTLAMKVSEDGSRVVYPDPGGATRLLESDLAAMDAEGREVAVRWEKLEHGLDGEVFLRLVVHAA
ncbi:MAG TPA: hypothetical protein VFW45_16760, partial [Candidatus Polarisedimenticolia bacterium]|nr:hypothetical protein [Candidatus Polarisedimenticolia bacterium]